MWSNDQNFYLGTHHAIQDVERKPRHTKTPDARRKLNAIPARRFTHMNHCRIERSQVMGTETSLTIFIVGNVLQVFNPRRLMEEVIHFSRASASWRTTSAAIRWLPP